MLGNIIRMARTFMYDYPGIMEDAKGDGKFGSLKVALLTDYLTSVNLSFECRVRSLTPHNFKDVLVNWKPDLVFVESAFHGYRWTWSYRLVKHSAVFGSNDLNEFSELIILNRSLTWRRNVILFIQPMLTVFRNTGSALRQYLPTENAQSMFPSCR